MAKIRAVYELYGFEAVETPFIEYTEALGKFLPDQDRPNEGVFSFKDDDEQWLSLRYDLTAPLARYVAENYERLPKPYRSYRAGWVFRNEKPGPGAIASSCSSTPTRSARRSPAADAEMCMMTADCLEALGIKRGDYVIKVNNRKVLDGLMEAIGLGGAENAGRRLTVLRAIDKFDRLGAEGVGALLGAGRKDESGDFTKGAELESKRDNRCASSEYRRRRSAGVRSSRRRRSRSTARSVGFARAIVRLRSPARRQSSKEGFDELDRSRLLWRGGLRRGPHPHRPLRRPRPRILHRPRLRGRTDLRDAKTRTAADPLRLGRRRRALRRAGGALSRRAGSGDRLLDRHLAPAGGAAGDRQSDRRRRRQARPGRRRRARPRPHGRLPAPRRDLARGGDRRRTLSRRARPQRPAQIRRPARQPVRDHPGFERARRAGRPRRSSSAISGSAPSSPRRARTAPTISNCARRPSSRSPRRRWSRGCAKLSRAAESASRR